jgi:FAD dependent oxidoreductase
MSLMSGAKCDILIVGGGTGGVAAAMMACELGYSVTLTEETDWLGGQLTAQIVPPDEHPWIEQFGCTDRYRRYRNQVRNYYRNYKGLIPSALRTRHLNPGSGWVSRLCHEPSVGVAVLFEMLLPAIASKQLTVLYRRKPHSADVENDKVRSVRFVNLENGEFEEHSGTVVLDATEMGDLLPMTGTEYVIGAESKVKTKEPNAVKGPAEPDNVQGLTWCFAMGNDDGVDNRITQPAQYEKWKAFKPDFWPGPLLGFQVLHAHTGADVELPLFSRDSNDWYELFSYRQIVDPTILTTKTNPVTIVNWPQNDYFEASIIDVDPLPSGNSIPDQFEIAGAMGPISASRLHDAKELSRSLLYWLQTDAPRHDDKAGAYSGLYMTGESTGTKDGFAKYPYIRESRRIKAQFTVKEQDLAAYTNADKDRAKSYPDSVGIGSYRIDLHPSTNGRNMIDTSTLPFEIPAGCMIPVRMKNLIPACKNIGVTHVTNGCYRLHPVEWNIGESAAAMACLMLQFDIDVQGIPDHMSELQILLNDQGVEVQWPQLHAL